MFLSINFAACSKEKPIVLEPIAEEIEKEVIEEEVIVEEIISVIIPLLTLENEQVLAEFEVNYKKERKAHYFSGGMDSSKFVISSLLPTNFSV